MGVHTPTGRRACPDLGGRWVSQFGTIGTEYQ